MILIKILKNEAGIQVVITTNGYHLDDKAKMLVDSGLNGINISIDSLDKILLKLLLVTIDCQKFLENQKSTGFKF